MECLYASCDVDIVMFTMLMMFSVCYRGKEAGGDTASYHSSEDSSDEEIHYRDDPDEEDADGMYLSKVP